MSKEKVTCKNCHGYWVKPDEQYYPFCGSDCMAHWQSWERVRVENINREISAHEKAIADLKSQI